MNYNSCHMSKMQPDSDSKKVAGSWSRRHFQLLSFGGVRIAHIPRASWRVVRRHRLEVAEWQTIKSVFAVAVRCSLRSSGSIGLGQGESNGHQWLAGVLVASEASADRSIVAVDKLIAGIRTTSTLGHALLLTLFMLAFVGVLSSAG
jgi:hypothetical protein